MFQMFGCAVAAVLWLGVGVAHADDLHGKCIFRNGSPAYKERISVSSGEGQYFPNPKDGFYRIDLGDLGGKREITVRVNGKPYTTMEVKGSTRLDILLPFTEVLFGTCRKAGLPVRAEISTSFDNFDKKFYSNPKDGFYRIDFGERRVRPITVRVNGRPYRDNPVVVNGRRQLNIEVP